MVQFKRTSAFINRIFTIGLGVVSESARTVVMRANETELLQEQNAIGQHYEGFCQSLNKI